jgi:hypothetical protein
MDGWLDENGHIPGGWFIFNDKLVKGPFKTKEDAEHAN